MRHFNNSGVLSTFPAERLVMGWRWGLPALLSETNKGGIERNVCDDVVQRPHWLTNLSPQKLCSGPFLLLLLLSIPPGFLLKNHNDGDEDNDDDLLLTTSQPWAQIPAQNAPRCPANCTCPTEETVDCGGLDLHIFPGNISKSIQHLSLQVTKELIVGQVMGLVWLGWQRSWENLQGTRRCSNILCDPFFCSSYAVLSSFSRITSCRNCHTMNCLGWPA